MFADCITYRREDILQSNSKSNSINRLHIVDNSLFRQLSRHSYNGLHKRRPTKRSARAGKRTKKMTCHRSSFSAITSEIVPTTVNTQQAAPRVRDNVFLPSMLYTNCRSLNTWKAGCTPVICQNLQTCINVPVLMLVHQTRRNTLIILR